MTGWPDSGPEMTPAEIASNRPKRLAWWSKVTMIMCLDEINGKPKNNWPLLENVAWRKKNQDRQDWTGAVWLLRDLEQDLKQDDRDAYVARYRPVLSVTAEERMEMQNKRCKAWWGRRLGRKVHPYIGAPHPWVYCLFALLLSCTYYGAAKAAETYDITNERRVKVGDFYDPGHGRRIQIRDSRRNIIGYIEKDGKITDKRRRKIGEVDDD